MKLITNFTRGFTKYSDDSSVNIGLRVDKKVRVASPTRQKKIELFSSNLTKIPTITSTGITKNLP
jgi:hypothetical protein